jgi:hypothetical protein
MTLADDKDVEDVLDQCLEAYERAPKSFTPWEIGFLNKLEESLAWLHPSPAQLAKLAQIYEERVP